MSLRLTRLLILLLISASTVASADPASFDLAGPKIEIKVTRAGRELPIAQTPNLAPGDHIWIRTDFPDTQAVHYLLIACFLRGATNQPPDEWFTRIETWDKHVVANGTEVTVPADAQQALLFLAPTTGGDFNTLRNAVKGRPGAFVRASQDLNAASFDRARFETYINTMERIPSADTKLVKQESDLLARSLNIKVNQDCFNRPQGQAIICLTSGENAVVMDDGHSSLIAQFTNGDSANLLANASATPLMGGGVYSAYVGAIVDVVHIMSNVHTAQYQYIPALSTANGDTLNIKLNNPPSFHNPKSVLVIGLPSVQSSQLPPLHAVDPTQLLCLSKPSLVLPVEGAPLIFSSSFGHSLVLHIKDSSGHYVDLPLTPDAEHGGLMLAHTANFSNAVELTGTVRGKWGFDDYVGPEFHLQAAPSAHWNVASAEAAKLVVGREESINLISDGAGCIDSIQATTGDGHLVPATWSTATSEKPSQLAVKLALKEVAPGGLTLAVQQYGMQQPIKVPLDTYSDPPTPQSLELHAGDTHAVITGKGLEQVQSVQTDGMTFTPGDVVAAKDSEALPLTVSGNASNSLKAGSRQSARIHLKDGRTLELNFVVAPARPRVTLDSKSVKINATTGTAAFLFSSADDLPLNATLTFFIHASGQARFTRNEKIEVTSEDASLHTELTLADGTLVLEDAHTLLATLDPMKTFGGSAFGALQFRAVNDDGSGDWQPLANLIRVPSLKEVRCPMQSSEPCTLTGDSLYLIDAISSDATFADASRTIAIPANFSGASLKVPRPSGTLLYLKLRDEPNSIDTVSLPVLPSE